MTDGNNKARNGDLCWGSDNAVLSLGGKSGELVKDDKTGARKPANDDGTKVERLTDTARANGDNDGEYWRVTDVNGVVASEFAQGLVGGASVLAFFYRAIRRGWPAHWPVPAGRGTCPWCPAGAARSCPYRRGVRAGQLCGPLRHETRINAHFFKSPI